MNAVPVSQPTPQISDDSTAAGAPARCLHRWPSGRRCRQAPEQPNSSFCPAHAAVEQNRHHGDRLHDLLLQTDNRLRTASDINNSLASLYVLLAEDRISARRAAVLAYISSLMLRTLPAVEKEESHDASQIILDLPRPQPPAEPEPDSPIAPAPVVAGLQTRSAPPLEAVIPSATRDLLFSPSLTPTTPPSPNPPSPQSSTIYRDANYDDHWFPTAHIIKAADEIERQRFAPKSPHPDAQHDARKPAA
jgi:hypothetical protein